MYANAPNNTPFYTHVTSHAISIVEPHELVTLPSKEKQECSWFGVNHVIALESSRL